MPKLPSAPIDLSPLSDLAPELAAALVAISSDIALVVDAEGIIQSVAVASAAAPEASAQWVGRPWADTVTSETRKKIGMLLEEAAVGGVSQKRQVNHPTETGGDIPMTYAAVRLGDQGPVLVAGRDLRAIAAIQQKFVESQQDLERGYWARRQAESRYRLLFQAATDAVLVVNGDTMRVLDVNLAATELFAMTSEAMVGQDVVYGIEPKSQRATSEMLIAARATGKPAEMRVRLTGRKEIVTISATPFRGDTEMLLLVRVSTFAASDQFGAGHVNIVGIVETMADAVAITDASGGLIVANPAFFALCELRKDASLRGRSISEWLGGSDVDLTTVLSEVRHRGVVTKIESSIRAPSGNTLPVEVSAALLTDGEQEQIGMILRPRAVGSAPVKTHVDALAQSIGELTVGLGHFATDGLQRSIAQMVQDHLARTALTRGQGNRMIAGQLLGIRPEDFSAYFDHLDGPASNTLEDGPTPPVLH